MTGPNLTRPLDDGGCARRVLRLDPEPHGDSPGARLGVDATGVGVLLSEFSNACAFTQPSANGQLKANAADLGLTLQAFSGDVWRVSL